MKERQIYLESHNYYNFRHGIENPKVIGLVNYTPEGLHERPCFKVEYESDNKIDFIPFTEITNQNWTMK